MESIAKRQELELVLDLLPTNSAPIVQEGIGSSSDPETSLSVESVESTESVEHILSVEPALFVELVPSTESTSRAGSNTPQTSGALTIIEHQITIRKIIEETDPYAAIRRLVPLDNNKVARDNVSDVMRLIYKLPKLKIENPTAVHSERESKYKKYAQSAFMYAPTLYYESCALGSINTKS